jgi:hypothetical protein
MKSIYILPVAFLLLTSCFSCDVKDKVNKAGDATGKVLGEFASGISNGVEEALVVKVVLSNELQKKGLQLGKTTVTSDSGANDNVLTVYIIFNQDFSGELTAKAFDNEKTEMGRAKLNVSGKKDDAVFFDFHFDTRTNIDNDSKLTIE